MTSFIHHFSESIFTLTQNNIAKFLSIQQKKIALVALAAISFIASVMLYYFRQKNNEIPIKLINSASEIKDIKKPTLSSNVSNLILNIDINRTIVADDSTAGYKLQDILAMLLAEHCISCWNGQAMSFHDYVNSLIPGSHNGPIKKQRQAILKDFVHLLTHFTFHDDSTIDFVRLKEQPEDDIERVKEKIDHVKKQIIKDLAKLRESDENGFEETRKKILQDNMQMHEKLVQQPHTIFPSFFRLIEWLKTKKNVHFHIIFRTFGNDAQKVVIELEKRFPEERFTHTGKYLNGKWLMTSIHDNKQHVLEKASDVYRYFKSNQYQHLALQDDWKEWNAHQENESHGKRFLVKLNSKNTHTMFIDDNIEEDGTTGKNIVTAINVENDSSISIDSLIAKKTVVRTDTITAICDDDYFVKIVQESLKLNDKQIS